ncbi:MAG: hypothetical protein K2K45_05075 [Muribaculaceae bacterium]|nr:hypothetical protein [Muribaculaceae bacterium]
MRVIKEGKKPVKEIEKQCDRCGCVFAYERGDVNSDQREGCWVYCPTCKKALSVNYFPNY